MWVYVLIFHKHTCVQHMHLGSRNNYLRLSILDHVSVGQNCHETFWTNTQAFDYLSLLYVKQLHVIFLKTWFSNQCIFQYIWDICSLNIWQKPCIFGHIFQPLHFIRFNAGQCVYPCIEYSMCRLTDRCLYSSCLVFSSLTNIRSKFCSAIVYLYMQ